MKKLLLAGVALAGLVAGAGTASAADLPVRTAPPPLVAAVPVFTWTGFYVGVNAGYGWHDSNDESIFVPAGALVTAPLATGFIATNADNGDGFVGGGQIGYNYQFGAFVLGVEADLQWADLGGSNDLGFVPTGFGTFVPAAVAGGLDWFGTVRARLGFAFDRALVYATGGFAYGGSDNNNNGFFDNNSDTRTGWTLGGGVEYAITNNVTLGVEGLWVNLSGDNNSTFIGTETLPTGAVVPVFSATNDRDDDNDFFVARAKLNYKF
jgi:outer membrane immunogenic protein